MRFAIRLLDAARWALYGVGFVVIGSRLWTTATDARMAPPSRMALVAVFGLVFLGFVTVMGSCARQLRKLYVRAGGVER